LGRIYRGYKMSDKKPKKESRTKVVALINFCNENGNNIKKGSETTLSAKDLKHFKKHNAIKEL